MLMTRDAAEGRAVGSRRARGATHDSCRSRALRLRLRSGHRADEEARPMLLGRRTECEQLDRLLTGSRSGRGMPGTGRMTRSSPGIPSPPGTCTVPGPPR